jgi:two-component system alkaline phosphatase synthesis response regulator PhoP
MSARILLVEDQADLRMIVHDLLVSLGHEPTGAATVAEALQLTAREKFDACLLDVMLPDGDGFGLCRQLRQQGYDGGILMLTARGQVEDRISGLEHGADDYVVKPFDGNELLARVTALLRRVQKAALTPVMVFEFGGVNADYTSGTVTRDGKKVNLAAKEFQLLRYLIDHRGQVLSRERLLETVWKQQPFITPRTVDTHISWLRQKLEADPQNPKHILTVRGEGYRFER